MKSKINIHILALLALVAPSLRETHATANAAKAADPTEELAALKGQVARQEAEIEQLRKASNVALETPVAPGDSTLAMLAKGAGIPLDDVTWRVRAGLTHGQAVTAALLQIETNEQIATANRRR